MTNYLVPVTVNVLPQISELQGKQGMFILPDGSININRKNGTWMIINKQSDHAGIIKPVDVPVIQPGDAKWYWAGAGTFPNANGIVIEKQGILSFDGTEWKGLELDVPNGANAGEINQIINDRFGVEIVDPGNPPIILDQTYATVAQYLTPQNTIGTGAGVNDYVIHDYNLNGATEIKVNGYILKESPLRVGILGIKPNGDIVNLSSSFADYSLLTDQVFQVSEFEKLSLCMASGFTIEVIKPNSTYFPFISEYFEIKGEKGEISERIKDRYISSYKGTLAMAKEWETSIFIRVENGDELDVEAYSGTTALYAIYDKNKNFLRYGRDGVTQGEKLNYTITADQQGYIVVGNFLGYGAEPNKMKIFINKNGIAEKLTEINQKLPFKYDHQIDFSTPINLASARFFEPYLDGDVLKIKKPVSFKDKLVLNDETNIIPDRYLGEHTFIYFKNRLFMYHTEALKTGNGIYDVIGVMSVGVIDEETEKYTYLQIIMRDGMQGIPANYSVHRSMQFVYNNYVYMVATVELGVIGEVWLFKSEDGLNFTKVKVLMTLAQSNGFTNFGHFWIVPDLVNGYFYAYYDGTTGAGGTWIMKLARSTSIEGNWSFIANVTGAGVGAMYGGTCAIVHNNKFRVFYHFGTNPTPDPNLPTHLGYAEAELSAPQTLSGHIDLLGLQNSPIGPGTDQNGDQAILEVNGSMWWGYQYAINTPILNGVLCYKKIKGLTYDKLFS